MLKNKDTSTIISVATFGLLLLGYCLYDMAGFVMHDTVWLSPLIALSFIAMIIVLAYRRPIEALIEPYTRYVKPIICVAVVFLAYYLFERPYNPSISGIPAYFTVLNLGIIAALFCIVYFGCQQTKTSAIVFLIACFVAGVANYFVITFKGQPVLPADLFALETAAAVGGGYTYAISDNVAKAFTVLAFSIMLVTFLPKAQWAPYRGFANIGAALACVVVFSVWFSDNDIEQAYGIEVDVWSAQESYAQKGSVLCFLKRAQDLSPNPPSDYSPERVGELVGAYTGRPVVTSFDYDDDLTESDGMHDDTIVTQAMDEPAYDESLERPAVVVIMNETFSDLSSYDVVSDTYEGPAYYNSIDDAVLKGEAYVSALGGGTCNSEFELLTGSTMASMGGGVYPYVLYDLDKAENLASYFKDFGYDTTAIHPAEAVNWRRDRIYSQLGFDTFHDIRSFEDSETLRGMPTDKETYSIILDQLQNDDDPQFIFDVTIQNHGGYDTGEIPSDMMISAPVDGVVNPEVDEYLSCIQQADEDLAYLMEGIKQLDRPVVVCFFGDHQPAFVDWLSTVEYGKDVSEFSLEEVQKRYTVPYMIWKNFDDAENGEEFAGDGSDEIAATTTMNRNLSLNYLGALTVQQTGLPLSDYQQFLLTVQPSLPALNLNGYMDVEGIWHWIGEESISSEVYADYALVQYHNLFATPLDTEDIAE